LKIISKLYLSVGLLLAIAIGGTLLAVACAREGSIHAVRMNLAHEEYEGYLSLSNHTYQLFKQFGDAILIGDRDLGVGETALQNKIRADIGHIRQLTAEEIRQFGEGANELEHLERIEAQINGVLVEYEEVVQSRDREQLVTYWARLSRMLDESIDMDFNQLIKEAIDREAAEVAREKAATIRMIRRFELLAAVFSLMAVLAATVSVWILRRDLREPIVKLVDGAAALARGQVAHKINVVGRNELDNVAVAFNLMAKEVHSREQALFHSNSRLEKAVSDRTEELEHLLEALKRADENRRRLLADVSHELRTPLTIIHGEAEIALRSDEQSPSRYRLALEKTRDAAAHTAELVDDLLFLARRESGEPRLKRELIDLSSLLPGIVEQYRAVAKQNDTSVCFVGSVDKAPARTDPVRIRQVVLILLENASRYGGRSIELRLDSAPKGYILTVSDDGPGMTDDERAHAFERFFRGSNAAVRYGQGSGLGLPVAKAIVEAHGGEITLKNSPSQGLTVSFTVPSEPKLDTAA